MWVRCGSSLQKPLIGFWSKFNCILLLNSGSVWISLSYAGALMQWIFPKLSAMIIFSHLYKHDSPYMVTTSLADSLVSHAVISYSDLGHFFFPKASESLDYCCSTHTLHDKMMLTLKEKCLNSITYRAVSESLDCRTTWLYTEVPHSAVDPLTPLLKNMAKKSESCSYAVL